MQNVGREMMNLGIRSLSEADRSWARALLAERWGSASVVTRGVLHQADALPGLVAFADGIPKGLATYRLSDGECELITLDSLQERCGIGTALLDAVRALAGERACRRLWLITTNDNSPAQRFYRNRGLTVAAIHKNAIAESRSLKPEIPEKGIAGIPIQDEIELEVRLNQEPKR